MFRHLDYSAAKLFIILCLSSAARVSCQIDPCLSGNFAVLSDTNRLDSSVLPPRLCDASIQNNTWYRFTGSTGYLLSTCDEPCAVSRPYALLPPDPHRRDSTETNGHVCLKQDNTSCTGCIFHGFAKIRWCNTSEPFYVYKLLTSLPQGTPCDAGYCNRVEEYTTTLSDPVIVARQNVTLTNGDVEEVHRFAFTCTINNISINPDSNRFDVTFKFRYQTSGMATISRTTDVNNLTVYLYEEELAPFFGTLVSCCAKSESGPEVCSNSYFVGFNVTDGTGSTTPKDQFPRRNVLYHRCLTASSLRLKLQLTVPLSCWHYTRRPGNQSCQYQPRIIDTNLINHACPSVITPKDYSSNVDIEPVAVPGRAYYYARIQFHRFLYAAGDVLNGYVIPSIKLSVRGSCRQRTCTSWGDPHAITFDSVRYHYYDVGIFLMVQAFAPDGSKATEIQARTRRCRGVVSCNCGVIVREGNHMIGVDTCDGIVKSVRYLDDPAVPQPVITSPNGRNYFLIKMPSGVVVRGYAYPDYMNIYISIPVYFSTFNISGLCGNANGISNDDIIPSTGGSQPLAFYQQYLLPFNESFFDPANIVCRTNPVYVSSTGHQRRCGCSADGMSAVCNVTAPVITRTTGASCSNVSQNTGRKKRQVTENLITLEELDYPFDTPDPLTDPVADPVWPTPSGLTREYVISRCQQALSFSSNAAPCGDLMDDAVNDCVFDVGQTDSVAYINNALQGFTHTCSAELAEQEEVNGTDPVLHFDPATVTLISPEVVEAAQMQCPNQCSAHGFCLESGCYCDEGYGDVDCSFNENQALTLETIQSGGLCDVTRELCETIRVSGSNIPSSDVVCKIQYTRNGVLVTDTGNATYEMGGTFACSLTPQPSSFTHYKVSLIWTNIETNSLQFTVYDSTCQQCQTSQVCNPKADVCDIDGTCYEDEEENRGNTCLTCNVSVSLTSWTPTFDAPTPQSPVSIYKFMGDNINHQLVISGVNNPNLIYLFASGSPSGLTLSASGLLGWPTDSDYIDVIVIVMQQPCGFQAELRVNLTVVPCLCQNGGTCMQSSGPSGLLFTCICEDGYNGVLCEIEPGVIWGPWSEWSVCHISTCTRRRERTCLVPPCTGLSSQYQCCPNCTSAVDKSEVSQGVHIVFNSTSDINIVLANAENGYRVIADAINAYCSHNRKSCCTSLGLDSKGEDTSGFVMTSWELVRIAAGYSTCSHRIQFLVTVLLHDARASCGSFDLYGRNKNRAIGDQYVDSNIVIEALFGIDEALENGFGVDILSTDVPSPEELNNLKLILLAGLLPLAAVCVLVIIVVACYAHKRKASRREEKHYDNGGFWRRHASRYHRDHWLDSDRRRYSSYSTDSSLIKSRYRYY